MIKKIKNKFLKYSNALIINAKKVNAIKNTVEDNFSLLILLKMFESNTFLSLTSWSISPKEVLHICNDIVINNRKNIIEFGSVFSTICIAQLIKKEKLTINFISVESNEDWIKILSKKLVELDLLQYVKFIYAPITDKQPSFFMKNQSKCYDEEKLFNSLNNMNFDCIIVDGPPSMYSPYIRYTALPFLKDKLSDDYSIFLDDFRRPIEKEILTEWKKILEFEFYDFDRYAYLTNRQKFETEPLTMHLF